VFGQAGASTNARLSKPPTKVCIHCTSNNKHMEDCGWMYMYVSSTNAEKRAATALSCIYNLVDPAALPP